jgi:hypothetical protein
MTGQDLAQQIAAVGYSPDDLAKSLHRHRDEVNVWLASRGPLPKGLARELEWVFAVRARERLMEQSGLPTCSWMAQHADFSTGDPKALAKRVADIEAHAKVCPVCLRRAAYAATLPALPPMPVAPHVRLLAAVARGVRRLPVWARPGAVGALVIGGWTLLRAMMFLVLGRAPLSPRLLLTVLAAIGLGAYGGLVGGVAYTLVRNPTRRLGRAGDYVTGVACAYAYLAAFGIPAAIFTEEEMFHSAFGWVILLVIGTVFGVVIGRSWFRSATPTAPTLPS